MRALILALALILATYVSSANATSTVESQRVSASEVVSQSTQPSRFTQHSPRQSPQSKLILTLPQQSRVVEKGQRQRSKPHPDAIRERGVNFDAWVPGRGALGVNMNITW